MSFVLLGQAMRLCWSCAVAFSSHSLLTWHLLLEVPTHTASEYDHFSACLAGMYPFWLWLCQLRHVQLLLIPGYSLVHLLTVLTTFSVLLVELLCKQLLIPFSHTESNSQDLV